MSDPHIEELKTLLSQCMLQDWVRLGSRLIRLLRDKHHPDKHEALLQRLQEQIRNSIALRESRRINRPQINYPPDLPITARKEEIVAAIRNHQVVVIAGETGSGKTTQIPKMCLEAGLGIEAKIGCTQPRRVAALSISRRIAEELNLAWGREVGCTIRFDDRSSPHTYIKLMTDGILLAETQGDPDLSEYNAIIIDEAHERSLNIDFLLGYLKTLLARRKDLKLIVTSATIDTEAFSRHFNNAPIIEVSGRVYPVEVVYKPLDAAAEENGDLSFVDAAVQATEDIIYETNSGDILIFMPGERDIRETGDMLEGRFSGETEVIPLFGRLSSGDQQKVFAPSHRRKIVIATNIAETSLTIPGIRYVIDTGLARISRYNPRTRTKRLPVEPVSQSSANQRKGRAGRVQDGTCVRLYSEEDFEGRSPFTQPEIQRSNLAEVILRMKAFRLGEIETFPFVQPPSPAAISNGYALLQELGALDDKRELTELGRDLARLPIDPTLGRMLLQSQREHATRELLIIAAGLSIQDPRERPLDQKEAAMAAHRKFNDPQSDFLALLNIWNEVHDQWEKMRGQSQRRKFCKQHFLSYLRMREWQDLHAQLSDALGDLGSLKLNESNAAYPAIHRSILAGLIGHIARREDRNLYKATSNREVTVFPGSVLYERGEAPRKQQQGKKPDKNTPKQRTNQPEWIVAGEIVETSQLFARTIAGIDPQWIYQLAPHACKLTHQNAHWSVSGGRVLVEEVVTLQGLEVQRRKVSYGNINPKEATEIFIRAALVEENILPVRGIRRDDADSEREDDRSHGETGEKELPRQYRFMAHNRAVRQKIENWQTRVRRYDLTDPDQALFQFYQKRLENVSSVHELNRLLSDSGGEQDFLCASEKDLAGDQLLSFDSNAFPDAVPLNGQPVALSYAYAPGEEHDGVTIKLPFTLAQSIPAALLDWAVPGLREEQVSELLRALPKAIRRDLMPFPPKVEEIVREFQPGGASFLGELARFIHRKYGVAVTESSWPAGSLPAHLRPRIEVIGQNQKTLGSGRNLNELRERFEKVKVEPAKEPRDWQRAAEKWERFGVTGWNFGDLPDRIVVTPDPELPLYAWPGLQLEERNVNLRLFRTADLARDASIGGVRRLVEIAIERDLGWLEKDLRALVKLDSMYAPIGDSGELRETALEHLKNYLLPSEPLPALTEAHFRTAVEKAKGRIPGIAQQFMDTLASLLQLRQQVQQRIGPVPAPVSKAKTLNDLSQLGLPAAAKVKPTNPVAVELEALLPSRFLDKTPYEKLPHLARYLKALMMRAERAKLNPLKDEERVAQVAPFREALRKLELEPRRSPEFHKQLEEFRWMIEEYKVSLFAQEVGTAYSVSPKRLQEQLDRVRQA